MVARWRPRSVGHTDGSEGSTPSQRCRHHGGPASGPALPVPLALTSGGDLRSDPVLPGAWSSSSLRPDRRPCGPALRILITRRRGPASRAGVAHHGGRRRGGRARRPSRRGPEHRRGGRAVGAPRAEPARRGAATSPLEALRRPVPQRHRGHPDRGRRDRRSPRRPEGHRRHRGGPADQRRARLPAGGQGLQRPGRAGEDAGLQGAGPSRRHHRRGRHRRPRARRRRAARSRGSGAGRRPPRARRQPVDRRVVAHRRVGAGGEGRLVDRRRRGIAG